MPLTQVYSAYGGLSIYKYDLLKGYRYGLIKNDDSRVEVKCEHFHLNDYLIQTYKAKFFINPNMTVRYQSINLSYLSKNIGTIIDWFIELILKRLIIFWKKN
jgi:hypothetical protein